MKRFIVFAMAFILLYANLSAQFKISNRVITTDQTIKETTVMPSDRTLPSFLMEETNAQTICTDLHSDGAYLPERDFSAVTPLPKFNKDGTLSKIGIKRQKLAGETNKMWDPGQTLNVHIDPNNSSQALRDSIMKNAREWEKYANIRFQEVNRMRDAQIKIGFKKSGHWSFVGKDALSVGPYDETMNIENPTSMSRTEFRGTVMHEFGHALGFIHEHQSPAAGINWDREKVYAYYANWPFLLNKENVDLNILDKYSKTSTNYSTYDSKSIMHYGIPAALTLDGKGTRRNDDLSDMDKYYARLLYPFPPTPENAFGVLRTGDDCDEIVFRVEYNAVNRDEIEFILMLGSDGGRDVTWWKQIVIPLSWNRENKLWVQNHSLIPQENRKTAVVRFLASEIDKSKGITFWKAKMLGVHTLLGYQWKVWEALPGGTRVTLSWNKDSCI